MTKKEQREEIDKALVKFQGEITQFPDQWVLRDEETRFYFNGLIYRSKVRTKISNTFIHSATAEGASKKRKPFAYKARRKKKTREIEFNKAKRFERLTTL